MDGWKKYEGQKVFLRTKHDRTYSGTVAEVIDNGDNVFLISLITSKGWVTVAASEIVEIKEEE